MKTLWILTLVIAGFWLTLFLSNFEPAKQETPGANFQQAVYGHQENLPQSWNANWESGFVFRTLSEEHAEIQIVLGLGKFRSNEGHRIQEKSQDLEALNINPRNI